MRTGPLWIVVCVLGIVAVGCIKNERIGEPQQPKVEQNKPFTVAESAFTFPEKIGDFERTDVHQYDKAGSDVSANFDSEEPPVRFTIYVYPFEKAAPKDPLPRHLQFMKSEVHRNNPGAKEEGTSKCSTKISGMIRDGWHAEFSYSQFFGGETRTVGSEAYLYSYKQHYVLYRVTYPLDKKTLAKKMIAEFMSSFEWPK